MMYFGDLSLPEVGNVFRFTGDLSHIFAVSIILLKFFRTKSSNGISGKTQILLAATYSLRYMDLFTSWISYYNTSMKAFYIGVSYLILYLTYSTYRNTYDWDADSFRVELLLFPVTLLAFLINHENSLLEITWTWSIYMESVSLVPQLYLIWKKRKADPYVIAFVLFMGLYRGMYILNWVYRYQSEGFYDLIAIVGGIIEAFVGIFGFLCVVSQALAHLSETSLVEGCDKSIYVLPLIPEDVKQKKSMEKYNSHLPL